jgi:hypothetical protein
MSQLYPEYLTVSSAGPILVNRVAHRRTPTGRFAAWQDRRGGARLPINRGQRRRPVSWGDRPLTAAGFSESVASWNLLPAGRTHSTRLSSTERAQWRLKMRRRIWTVPGVLLIAILTIQTATAAARHARKSARAPVPVTQELRESHGLSVPAAVQVRSCDRFWCYEDGAPVSASRK